jgi:hypothetical protein
VSFVIINEQGGYKLNWWDYVLIVVSALCAIGSIIGAVRANIYYKKSKQLTLYAHTNVAYIEAQKITAALTELLKLSNSTFKKRGVSNIREISRIGENIKTSLNKIRDSLPASDVENIGILLNSRHQRAEEYIDSFITGTVLVDENIVIGNDFNSCQQKFYDLQLLLKRRLEEIAEKIK